MQAMHILYWTSISCTHREERVAKAAVRKGVVLVVVIVLIGTAVNKRWQRRVCTVDRVPTVATALRSGSLLVLVVPWHAAEPGAYMQLASKHRNGRWSLHVWSH